MEPRALDAGTLRERRKITFPSAPTVARRAQLSAVEFLGTGRSFLRLKNVEIGYTFPKEMLQKVKISNLRLYQRQQPLYVET